LSKRETSTGRLIDEDDVGVEIPRVGIRYDNDSSLTIIEKLKRAIFVENG
jgi:hypothetical protein